MAKALVLGAGGFIGSHMVQRLKNEGYWVRGVDLKKPEFAESVADEFIIGDLRKDSVCKTVIDMPFDSVYQFAADMGGAGFVFTGENDADIVHNSAKINLNIAEKCKEFKVGRVFYSSSACVYNEIHQLDSNNSGLTEDMAYPAAPDSEYGWEKLFSERLYLSFQRNCQLQVRIARYHNIFGPQGCFEGGREKAPAALCRKIALADSSDEIDVWGDGKQTRSFLYIDECIEATRRLMDSDFSGPINIGSEEIISIDDLTKMIIEISGKSLSIRHIPGPQGVRGRTSNNSLLREKLDWAPSAPLQEGIQKTYEWIKTQIKES